MKKTNLFLLFILLPLLWSCEKEEQPTVALYPSTATYEIANTQYTATQSAFETTPLMGFSGIEGINGVKRFIIKNNRYTFLFTIQNKADGTFPQVGEIIPFSYVRRYSNGNMISFNNNSSVWIKEANVNDVYQVLPTIIDEKSTNSYFKITRNNAQYLEGEFTFTFGKEELLAKNADGTETIVKPASIKGEVKNGFISIKKNRMQ